MIFLIKKYFFSFRQNPEMKRVFNSNFDFIFKICAFFYLDLGQTLLIKFTGFEKGQKLSRATHRIFRQLLLRSFFIVAAMMDPTVLPP